MGEFNIPQPEHNMINTLNSNSQHCIGSHHISLTQHPVLACNQVTHGFSVS